MRKLFLMMMMVIPSALCAQNVICPEVSTFDNLNGDQAKGWWIAPANRTLMSVVEDMAKPGNHCLKVSIEDFGEVASYAAQSVNNKQFGIKLEQGKYTLSLDVYLPATGAPNGFLVSIANPSTKFFKASPVKASEVDGRDKWVRVTRTIEVDACENAKISLGIRKDAKFGGPGTVYFDNISLVKAE